MRMWHHVRWAGPALALAFGMAGCVRAEQAAVPDDPVEPMPREVAAGVGGDEDATTTEGAGRRAQPPVRPATRLAEEPGASGASATVEDPDSPASAPLVTDDVALDADGWPILPDPVRLRPGVLPEGYAVVSVDEFERRGESPFLVEYAPESELDALSGRDDRPSIAFSVSTGDQLGWFEELWPGAAMRDEPVDLGVAGLKLTDREDRVDLLWLDEDGRRIAVLGHGTPNTSVIAAAESLRMGPDGPVVEPEALPYGYVEHGRTAPIRWTSRTTTIVFQETSGGDRTGSSAQLVVTESSPASAQGSEGYGAPYDPVTDPERWSAATFRGGGETGTASVVWRERPGVSGWFTSWLPKAEVRALVNGLEAVDEEEWSAFVAFARAGARPTDEPNATWNLPVPAAPSDTVWDWLERGRLLGTRACEQHLTDPPLAYQLELPDYWAGNATFDVSSLTDEQRTVLCER